MLDGAATSVALLSALPFLPPPLTVSVLPTAAADSLLSGEDLGDTETTQKRRWEYIGKVETTVQGGGTQDYIGA
ncbi:hypothetical protein CVT25_002146 [Psilocybe cyanescens]|uniref:Uncharacterized protein n=1 Tax=Psilocybe cyanescens TaxID=93625 RepID=A0A409X0F0_PSICY|nr:hypothetical protein CVT25_002146 [Psilocybe cyanescens]